MADESTLPDKRARFEALALPHLDAAFNLARWLARDDQNARDIVQEAYLRAYAAFDGLRGDNARPWLLAIVRNTCFTWLARNGAASAQVEYDDEIHGATAAQGDPETLALRADADRVVDAAIERLPLEFREVIVLRELEDMAYKDIAAVLAIPVGTVMSRLARGRRLLARYLAAERSGA
ncbi:MAG: sigma-70 family RNA polymerase sigma factor [Rhodocyclaceae bacterium]|nr:sigma-70 family RNA polymerase sigma factor [Rhodocyclaceae bacterium]